MSRYFSESDVELFTMFNIDMGDALVAIGKRTGDAALVAKGERIDEDLWHFRKSKGYEAADKKTIADAKMNEKESRAARVAQLAGAYSRMESMKLSPFDWGMKEV